jgi:outer membrane receptor protein involved in Fe transport
MRVSKFCVILSVLLLLPLSLVAGTKGKIAGVVVDKATGELLPGVNVIVSGTFLGASTDIDGTFFIIQVPAGTCELEVSYVGYQTIKLQDVRVKADLTTRADFELSQVAIDLGEVIVVTAERPLIQTDLTASRTILDSKEIQLLPIDDIVNIVNITPGFVDGHARGGRGGEILYQIDGVAVMDPMTKAFDSDIPELSVEEISITTGGFNAEFGDAQSGVVNMVIREGGPLYSGSIRYRASDFSYMNPAWKDDRARHNIEATLGGPEPISTALGYGKKLRFFIAGEYEKDNGRFRNQDTKNYQIESKLTWTPTQRHKITFQFGGNWNDFGQWNNRYKRYTDEDKNSLMKKTDPDDPLYHWYDNGQLDYEDVNRNGFLDPGEDLNGNGLLDTEDLNQDDQLNVFDMLDHVPEFELRSNHIILNWTYQMSSKSFFEAKFSRNYTYQQYNVIENINEDTDGDFHLDLAYDITGDGEIDDIDGDGDYRHEDLNGNLRWDWKEQGGYCDLFKDENNNDYVDASEGNPRDQWIWWGNIPIGNTQDEDGFYAYGNGTTYNRQRWGTDEKSVWGMKLTYYNQLDLHNEIKTGVEFNYYDLYDFDRDVASGGNIYGQNIRAYPFSGAAFFEDKVEYSGMIINAGVRLDYWDANAIVPGDEDNPVDFETNTIADPVKTEPEWYFSPRLGIAYPISQWDVIYFNYGRYFQIPALFLLYRNTTYDLSGAFPLVGNPAIRPERTTAYELALKHQFTDNLKVELKGFYKDIQGLTDTKQIYYSAANYYTLYENIDYGNIRGFEIELMQRYSRYWGGRINYTYSIAKGKSSSSRQNYDVTWSGDIIPTEENFLNWDQRHTVNASLNFRMPPDERLFGIPGFNDIGLYIIGRYGSGLPYSSGARTRVIPINDQRMPATYILDVIFDKQFSFSERYKMKLFLWINNWQSDLFGHTNILRIADVGWYDQDQDGDGQPDRDPTGSYNDPSVYSEQTTYRLGIQFMF